MKYVVFTHDGSGLPLAWQLQREGHHVITAKIDDPGLTLPMKSRKHAKKEDPDERQQRLLVYKNMLHIEFAEIVVEKLKKVKNPQDYFLFFDSNNLFHFAQQLQNLGFHGNFPIEEDRLFEVDRDKAKEFVKKYYPHLRIAAKKAFASVKKASAFISGSNTIWVLKSQSDDVPTFVPTSNVLSIARQQLLQALKSNKEEYEKYGFFLERKIHDFIEITPEKLYYDGVPLGMTMNFENKFVGSGNIASQVGCAGDLVFPISMKSKIHDICFPPMIDEMAKQHKGLFIWDASVLIDRKTGEMYFGEFCSNRPGFNCFYTEVAQLPSLDHFFTSVVAKKNPFTKGTIGASVTLFNFLRDDDDNTQKDAAIVIDPKVLSHVWLYDIYQKKNNPFFYTVGYDYLLGPVTASGKTIQEAVDKLYSYVDKVALADMYYRPKFDFLSKDYRTSIMNRLQYCKEKKLF